MSESISFGCCPDQRHLDLAAQRFREIAGLLSERKEKGLVTLWSEAPTLSFLPLGGAICDRIAELGVPIEDAQNLAEHVSRLDAESEASVLVIERESSGRLTAGVVNLILPPLSSL